MQEKLKIIMLEDLEEDAWLIGKALQKDKIDFTSVRVDSRDEFVDALDNFGADVILSDHSLPQFNSIEALKICQAKGMNVPFILVTGAVSEEFAVTCLKKGADDYILKSNLSRLPLSIRYALRQREDERLRKEQNVKLRLQNIKLKKLNSELDLFVYSTSHNLRSPLRSVTGLINLSKHELAQKNIEVLSEYLDMMEKSVSKLDETLGYILQYSQSSRLRGDTEVIQFEKLLQNIFDEVRYIDGYQTVSKNVNVHPGPPFSCNKMRLNMILLNLVSNAVRYCDAQKAGPYLKIEVFPEDTKAVIVVEDNGIEIADELQARVFDMFYRATEKSDGSGLGLYIVKETVERMNGSIVLESGKGNGTRFTISIPNSGIGS